MRVGVLSNLRAGQRASKVAQVSEFLVQYPEVLHETTPHASAVRPALDRMAGAGVEILVINGGDGTIQHVLTELYGTDLGTWRPWLAPIAGGRTNMIVSNLNGQPDPVRGLARLLDAERGDHLEARQVLWPVLRLRFDDTVHCGTFLGFGMLQRATQLVHDVFPPGKARGVFGATVVIASLALKAALGSTESGTLTPDRMRFIVDGEDLGLFDVQVAIATTLEKLVVGLVPFWGVEHAPARLSIVRRRAYGFGRSVLGMLWGRPGRHVTPANGYLSRNVHSFEVELDAGVVLDGEIFEPRPGRRVLVDTVEGVKFLRA